MISIYSISTPDIGGEKVCKVLLDLVSCSIPRHLVDLKRLPLFAAAQLQSTRLQPLGMLAAKVLFSLHIIVLC